MAGDLTDCFYCGGLCDARSDGMPSFHYRCDLGATCEAIMLVFCEGT